MERNLSIAGCEPPCWGGITPGKTSWQDVLDLWQGWVVKVNEKSGFTYVVIEMNRRLYAYDPDRVEIWSKDGTVTGISIRAQLFDDDVVYTGTLNTYLTRFQLPDVLEQYGPPSRVYAEGFVGAFYNGLWTEYADQGLSFGYTTDTVLDSAAPLICPIAEGAPHIVANFQAPGDTFQNYREYVEATEEYYDDWKEIEYLLPEAFYAAFRKPASPNCLRVVGPISESMTSVLPDDFDPILRPAEDARLTELLATNSGCELPCWWGITPGVTRIEEVQALFAGYGKPIGIWNWRDEAVYEVGLFARHDPEPLDYVVRQSFIVEDGVVSAIHIDGVPPMPVNYGDGPQPDRRYQNGIQVMTISRHLTQDWQRYSLASTLARFGVPSQVSLFYDNRSCGNAYQVGVAYDDLGIFIQYDGEGQYKDDNTMMLCPSPGSITDFHFILTTPDSEFESGEQTECGYRCTVSLETASDMSIDAFYRTYIDSASSACISVLERTEPTCP